ncbi:MAG: hypothetical protein HQ514_18775 [Rhodospirillales bacterium]|nr:hypothetical protein [Rhodospirillales bacterium]
MTKRIKWAISLAAVFLAMAAPARLQAADLPVSAFFGTYSGGGVAENEDSIYFAVTARDMDVVIRPEGPGFKVTWTSVIRRGGDPSNPKIKRKSTSRAFMPTKRPGIFRAADSADPVSCKEMCWARIKGQSLIVYQMVIGDDGAYQLQRYARTLSGLGMQLTFTRLKDGERVRTVKGRMVKTAN